MAPNRSSDSAEASSATDARRVYSRAALTPTINQDEGTVAGFGDEWTRFDQSELGPEEVDALFGLYFRVFPWGDLPANAEGFDLGSGSGRWARRVAPRVGRLHCVDASAEALAVAKRNLADHPNCVFHHASAGALPFADASMDFGYSLGVLHHVPDTAGAIREAARKLRPGAPLLLYLYYAFDNRPRWYRELWRASDVLRRGISRAPFGVRYWMSQALAAGVYLPLARVSRIAERLGIRPDGLPLSAYRHRSFYTMRTDALDRFGTRLEQRFTRAEIAQMMSDAGLERVTFSDDLPFWCAVGFRASSL